MKSTRISGRAMAMVLGFWFLGGLTGRAEWAHVREVIDGDTFITDDGTRVRVKDIDTPETKHPLKGVEPGGEQASELARFFLKGNYVQIEGNATDKYGRRVAAVYLPGGSSYADIARSHGLDKETRGVYAIAAGTGMRTPLQGNPYLYSSPAMVWVEEHMKADGTYVPGQYRMRTSAAVAGVQPSLPSFGGAPASAGLSTPVGTGTGGATGGKTVSVNGYYRSNGTYVQPYCRSAPRSR